MITASQLKQTIPTRRTEVEKLACEYAKLFCETSLTRLLKEAASNNRDYLYINDVRNFFYEQVRRDVLMRTEYERMLFVEVVISCVTTVLNKQGFSTKFSASDNWGRKKKLIIRW